MIQVTEREAEAHQELVDAAWEVYAECLALYAVGRIPAGTWLRFRGALRANLPRATEPDPDEARDRMYDL